MARRRNRNQPDHTPDNINDDTDTQQEQGTPEMSDDVMLSETQQGEAINQPEPEAKSADQQRLDDLLAEEASINAEINRISKQHDDEYEKELEALKERHDMTLAEALADLLDKQNATRRDRLTLELRVKLDSGALDMDQIAAIVEGRQPTLFGGAGQGRQRQPRGYMLTRIKGALDGKPDGLTRGELINAIGVTGDQTAINALSNSLVQGKKSGELGHNADTGKYFLP